MLSIGLVMAGHGIGTISPEAYAVEQPYLRYHVYANATIVACVGDSITAGYLSSPGMSYPTQMQKLHEGLVVWVSRCATAYRTMILE